MGELFEKSSPIPPQKLPNNNSKIESLVCKQTVDARHRRAFAIASAWAPPRPHTLRELITTMC